MPEETTQNAASGRSRELVYPMVTVERKDAEEGLRLRFRVLGSKFGAVEVVMFDYEAEALAADILEALRG